MKKICGLILIICSVSGSISGLVQVPDQETLNRNSTIKVDPFRLSIILPSSGIQFYGDGLVFLSQSKNENKMLQNHISFGKTNAYYVIYDDTIPGKHIKFSSSGSFDVPCDAMTFNSDYTVMYYTRKPSGNDQEMIFRAEYRSSKGGKQDWITDQAPLRFCTDKFTYSHPSLSADGEMMVFSSNRTGSAGGFDIFLTRMEGSDWSSPVNGGNLINTAGDEVSPFLDQKNNLFFSSDGHPGSGGLDIYLCKFNGSGWDKPMNLTDMINTKDDELAFTLDRSDGQLAFFTRRMNSGKGSMKLYKVTFHDKVAANQLTNLSNAFTFIAMGDLQKSVSSSPVYTAPVSDIQVKNVPVADTIKQVQPEQVATKPTITQPPVTDDAVVYRIQFATNAKPKGNYEITVNGKKYTTFEYLNNGAYKLCAGEFSSSNEAAALQKTFRQNGYKDAFIVVFRNNVRVLEPVGSQQLQAANKAQTVPVTSQKQAESKQVAAKAPVTQSATDKNVVIYRVQFASGRESRGNSEMLIQGQKYSIFEYFYNGANRYCVGEFSVLPQAFTLQQALKLEGFKDAFVVAFKNNVRSLDPELFK